MHMTIPNFIKTDQMAAELLHVMIFKWAVNLYLWFLKFYYFISIIIIYEQRNNLIE